MGDHVRSLSGQGSSGSVLEGLANDDNCYCYFVFVPSSFSFRERIPESLSKLRIFSQSVVGCQQMNR